jgi:hypothetical protein
MVPERVTFSAWAALITSLGSQGSTTAAKLVFLRRSSGRVSQQLIREAEKNGFEDGTQLVYDQVRVIWMVVYARQM